jgi:hypothetical protein
MRTKSVGLPARKVLATGFVHGRKLVSRPGNPMVAALVARKASSAGGRHLKSKGATRSALTRNMLDELVSARLDQLGSGQ